jgi:hypothetical protein
MDSLQPLLVSNQGKKPYPKGCQAPNLTKELKDKKYVDSLRIYNVFIYQQKITTNSTKM